MPASGLGKRLFLGEVENMTDSTDAELVRLSLILRDAMRDSRTRRPRITGYKRASQLPWIALATGLRPTMSGNGHRRSSRNMSPR